MDFGYASERTTWEISLILQLTETNYVSIGYYSRYQLSSLRSFYLGLLLLLITLLVLDKPL
jgi:hypothetical protein